MFPTYAARFGRISISYQYSMLLDWNSTKVFIITGSADRVFFPLGPALAPVIPSGLVMNHFYIGNPKGRYDTFLVLHPLLQATTVNSNGGLHGCISPCIVQPVREQINYCATPECYAQIRGVCSLSRTSCCKLGTAPYLPPCRRFLRNIQDTLGSVDNHSPGEEALLKQIVQLGHLCYLL